MYKRKIIWTVILLLGFTGGLRAQSQEAQQLLLNVTKLDALNGILKNMEDGWRLVSSGYRTVKNVSEGNFSIHRIFLDNLMQVNPAVRNYRKVGGIVSNQLTIVREYKKAYNRFRDAGTFNADEIGYLGRVYDKLFAESMKNLDALAMLVTAGQLRMSDEERLELIDNIHRDTEDQLIFLRDFNGKTAVLSMQRHREKSDIDAVKGLHGIRD